MTFNLKPLIPIYQNAIDSIITEMGKDVLLVFPPTITQAPSDASFDKIRNTPSKKPDFKQEQPESTENTKIIKCLIRWNPKDKETYELRMNADNKTIIRLKMFMTDVPDFERCSYIIPNYDANGLFNTRFAIIKKPYPVGLGQDRYSISYWVQIG